MSLMCRTCGTTTPLAPDNKNLDRYRCPACKRKFLLPAGAPTPSHCGVPSENEAQLDYDILRCARCNGIVLVEYDVTYVDAPA
jgi:DNA-directed RNA polymerase subunit RPC12/RpoP